MEKIEGKRTDMWKILINSIFMLFIFTILTGVIYPLGMTGLAQMLFPGQSNGSMLARDGNIIGSKLIGQNFSNPGYFHGRPSAAGDNGYDAAASSGSNFGPTSQKFKETVQERATNERRQNNLPEGAKIPSDLVLAALIRTLHRTLHIYKQSGWQKPGALIPIGFGPW
jgi:K+-transporting ATPase ATPase C chain